MACSSAIAHSISERADVFVSHGGEAGGAVVAKTALQWALLHLDVDPGMRHFRQFAWNAESVHLRAGWRKKRLRCSRTLLRPGTPTGPPVQRRLSASVLLFFTHLRFLELGMQIGLSFGGELNSPLPCQEQ